MVGLVRVHLIRLVHLVKFELILMLNFKFDYLCLSLSSVLILIRSLLVARAKH